MLPRCYRTFSHICPVRYFCKTCVCFFFFQAEDGIRDLVRSRGLGDVYKRQASSWLRSRRRMRYSTISPGSAPATNTVLPAFTTPQPSCCLLYTSDAADERSSVDLGGRRIIKNKKNTKKREQKKEKKTWCRQDNKQNISNTSSSYHMTLNNQIYI